jgi:hypothetical protein
MCPRRDDLSELRRGGHHDRRSGLPALRMATAEVPGIRMAQPGELLFEFMRHERIRCELRDHGKVYGVEAQWVDQRPQRASR